MINCDTVIISLAFTGDPPALFMCTLQQWMKRRLSLTILPVQEKRTCIHIEISEIKCIVKSIHFVYVEVAL